MSEIRNSEYFYIPARAFYDGGVDYLTREKHRLVVIAQYASIQLYHLETDDLLKHYPFIKELLASDQKLLRAFEQKFKTAEEIRVNEETWRYTLNYDEQIAELDRILLKYIEFFEGDFYKDVCKKRFEAYEKWLEENPLKEDEYSYF